MGRLALHDVRVAPDPKLALRIKRARERMGLKQWQLAELAGVNRKTVDNWENARTTPRSSMGALEAVLGNLDPGDDQLDVNEQQIRSMYWLSPAEQDELIVQYRQRSRTRRTAS